MVLPLEPDSTADQWLDHPEAGPWLRSRLGDEGIAAMLDDPHSGQMIRAIPPARLARFPGFPVDDAQIAEAAAKFNRS